MAGSKGNSLLPGVLRPLPGVTFGGDGSADGTAIRNGAALRHSVAPAMSAPGEESAVGVGRPFVLSSLRAG